MKREHAVVTEGKARFVFGSDSVKKVETGHSDCCQKRNSGYREKRQLLLMEKGHEGCKCSMNARCLAG